jgi:hypothetical protein
MEIKQHAPNQPMTKEKIKWKIKKICRADKNGHTTYQNLWDAAKTVLGRMFIIMNIYI